MVRLKLKIKNVVFQCAEHLCCRAERCRHGGVRGSLTHGAVDACVLVVAEEEALFAATLVAAHGVDARVLAAAVVELAFVHICRTAGVIATVNSVYKSLEQNELQSQQTLHTEVLHFKIRFSHQY